jgi:squalene-hopene/tetraprenyl-beta-curcumene cyclase
MSPSTTAGVHDPAFLSNLSQSLSLASEYSRAHSRHDGHQCEDGRFATTAAEYILFHHALGLQLRVDPDAIIFGLFSQQDPDGSWGVAPQQLGDVSVTVEAYLALKLLGVSVESQPMRTEIMP